MYVQRISLNNANVRYSNANDESREYDIEANFQIQEGVPGSVDSGTVVADGVQIAIFNKFDGRFNPTFYFEGIEEQYKVLVAINEFIASVEENIKTSTFNI